MLEIPGLLTAAQTYALLSYADVKRLSISKRGVRSRHGYGKCTRCKAGIDTFRFELYRSGRLVVEESVCLRQECRDCGNSMCWWVLGLWNPAVDEIKSSFRRPRDSQRQIMYNWERAVLRCELGNERLSKSDFCAVVSGVFAEVGMAPCQIKFVPEGKFSYMTGYWYMQIVEQWGMNRLTGLHEAAHAVKEWLVHREIISQEAGHGPVWVGIYVWLLHDRLGYPVEGLEESLRDAGIDVTPQNFIQYYLKQCEEL